MEKKVQGLRTLKGVRVELENKEKGKQALWEFVDIDAVIAFVVADVVVVAAIADFAAFLLLLVPGLQQTLY